jgi:hypothetical protein
MIFAELFSDYAFPAMVDAADYADFHARYFSTYFSCQLRLVFDSHYFLSIRHVAAAIDRRFRLFSAQRRCRGEFSLSLRIDDFLRQALPPLLPNIFATMDAAATISRRWLRRRQRWPTFAFEEEALLQLSFACCFRSANMIFVGFTLRY